MDNPITPSLSELVRRLREAHELARKRGGDMMTLGEGYPVMIEAAEAISRLMAQGGLVEPLQPSASLEVNNLYEECAALLMEKAGLDFRGPWQCDLDDVERGRYEALIAVIIHATKGYDLARFGASDAACYKFPGADQTRERAAYCDGVADALLQASEGCGSSNPVDDGAVERVLVPREATKEMLAAMASQIKLYDPKHFTPEAIAWEAYQIMIEAAEPHP